MKKNKESSETIYLTRRDALLHKFLQPKILHISFNLVYLIALMVYTFIYMSTPINQNITLSVYLFIRGILQWFYFQIAFFLLVRYISSKVTGALNLFLAFLIIGLSDLFKTYSLLLVNISEDVLALSIFFYQVSFLLLLLSAFIFIWYISSMINSHFQYYEYGPAIFVIFMYLTYILLAKVGELESIMIGEDQLLFIILGENISVWLMGSIVVYFIFVGVYSTFHLQRIKDKLRSENLRNTFNYFSLCIILIFILLPISFGVLYLFLDPALYNFTFQQAVSIVPLLGMAIAVYPFLKIKEALSIQPGLAEHIIILREGGMILYHHEFLKSEEDDNFIHLFSGFLTMISELFKETRKISDVIDYMEFENKFIVTRSTESTFYVLVTGKITPTLIGNFDNFCNSFYTSFITDIKKAEFMHTFLGSKEQITDLVHQNFGS